jgi:hypothetical protein
MLAACEFEDSGVSDWIPRIPVAIHKPMTREAHRERKGRTGSHSREAENFVDWTIILKRFILTPFFWALPALFKERM